MNRKRYFIALAWCWLAAAWLSAQPLCRVVQFDEEDGVPSSHLSQQLQDERGFMWFATWNGLARFDSYEFQTFKPQGGDGCHMTTDRLRGISLRPDGSILCRTDEDVYLFDTRTYRFRDLEDAERQRADEEVKQYRQTRSVVSKGQYAWTDSHQTLWTFYKDGRLTYRRHDGEAETDYPLNVHFNTPTFACPDRQGNLWCRCAAFSKTNSSASGCAARKTEWCDSMMPPCTPWAIWAATDGCTRATPASVLPSIA